MPFINTKVNVSISKEQEQTLKTQFVFFGLRDMTGLV